MGVRVRNILRYLGAGAGAGSVKFQNLFAGADSASVLALRGVGPSHTDPNNRRLNLLKFCSNTFARCLATN